MTPDKLATIQQVWANWLLAAGLTLTVLGALAGFASAIIGGKASDHLRVIATEKTAAARSLAESAEARAAVARADAAKASKDAADANLAAAAARERAAQLEVQAETLRSRLETAEHVLSGRRLTTEQKELLAKTVRGRLHFPIAIGGDDLDTESETLAFDISFALREGGAKLRKEYGMPAARSAGSPYQVTLYAPTLVERNPFLGLKSVPPDIDPLYCALTKVGFNVTLSANVLEGVTLSTPDYYSLRVEKRGPSYIKPS